jgi:hypothetical protein
VLDAWGEVRIRVQYLEIVTPDVDAVCATYARLHGVNFGEPEPGLGSARTSPLPSGGLLGVRAPASFSSLGTQPEKATTFLPALAP